MANDNPFDPIVPTSKAAGFGQPQPWDVGGVITEAWAKLQPNLVPIIVGWIIVGGISFGVAMALQLLNAGIVLVLTKALAHSASMLKLLPLLNGVLSMSTSLINSVVSSAASVGLIRIILAAARNQPVELGMVATGFDRIATMVGTTLLGTVAAMAGTLAFCVGGIYVALGIAVNSFVVMDTDLGAVDAFKAGWGLTDGHRVNILILWLALGVLNLAGLATCGLGLFVTIPLSFMSVGIVYTRLAGR